MRLIQATLISLLLATTAEAATITIQLPDDVVRSRIEYVCQPGRVDCEGKSKGEVMEDAIDMFLAKTGFSTWMLSKLGLEDAKITVSYSDNIDSCKKVYDGCNTCTVCPGGMSTCTTMWCDYDTVDIVGTSDWCERYNLSMECMDATHTD